MNEIINNKIITIAIFLIALLSLGRTVYQVWQAPLLDFHVVYNGSMQLLHHQDPYINNSNTTLPVNYMPLILALFFPFVILGFGTAAHIWTVISVILFFASFYLLFKISPLSIHMLAVVLLLAVLSFPFKFNLVMGQVNIFLVFLLSALIYSLMHKNKYLPLSFAAATFLKLIPVVFLLIPIFERKWGSVVKMIIMLFFLELLSILLFTFTVNIDYILKVIIPLVSISHGGAYYYDQSLLSAFQRIGIPAVFANITRIFIAGVTIRHAFKYSTDKMYSFSLLLTGVLLISSIIWQHYLILLLIPFYYLLTVKVNCTHIFNLCLLCSNCG